MLVANLVESAWTANGAIALNPVGAIATNGNLTLTATGIEVNEPGWYKVRLQANVTAGAAQIGAVLAQNGVNTAATEVSLTTTSGDLYEITIEYPVQVVAASSGSTALLQFIALGIATPTAGFVFVDKMQ